MGLPEDELTLFIHLRDGILHPEKIEPAAMLDPAARRAVRRPPARRSTSISVG